MPTFLHLRGLLYYDKIMIVLGCIGYVLSYWSFSKWNHWIYLVKNMGQNISWSTTKYKYDIFSHAFLCLNYCEISVHTRELDILISYVSWWINFMLLKSNGFCESNSNVCTSKSPLSLVRIPNLVDDIALFHAEITILDASLPMFVTFTIFHHFQNHTCAKNPHSCGLEMEVMEPPRCGSGPERTGNLWKLGGDQTWYGDVSKPWHPRSLDVATRE
jgi:hypothetical protein